MPIVTCPGCNRRIELSMDDLRLSIQCVQCQTVFCPLTGERIADLSENSIDPEWEID